ncbi:MAG TPA: MFS transporter [Candidatus Angelobacter sp.]|jgi:MFS family permease
MVERASVRNLSIIYLAAWFRSFGIGLLGVVLGVFLFRRGFSSTAIGMVIAAGIAGSACGTVFITFRADGLGRRRTLFLLSLLTAGGVIPLVFHFTLVSLLLFAFLGMLNGMGTDRSPAFALEQATIPGLVADQKRTWALAWYSVVLDASGAFGALAAGLPLLAQRWWGIDLENAYRTLFIGYAAINAVSAVLYLFLSSEVEVTQINLPELPQAKVSQETKSIVTRISALFAIDAFGGGFLTDALVSYWFFRRFGLAESQLALLFFVVHILNAVSHLGAAWLAKQIGLIKTMIFTHLPSSIFLIASAFMPSAKWAVVLFLLRESLVEMDVPTRQSYVAAVVQPTERTFAAGVTNLVRNTAWAAASAVAGVFMQQVAFAAPLLLGGGLKIIYDGLLWRAFRHVVPPEEQKS